jgi:D-alanyl-lipoteichoic acid acyltransferase DltB (MBOAT superfamily)
MLLPQILFFTLIVVAYRVIFGLRRLPETLFVLSLLGIFWFQPLSTIRTLDFWLPSLIILFSVMVWGYLFGDKWNEKQNRNTFVCLAAFFLLLGVSRFFEFSSLQNHVSVPGFGLIIAFLLLGGVLFFLSLLIRNHSFAGTGMIIIMGLILIIQKYPPAADWMSTWLRSINRQSLTLASGSEIAWIGFSYFSFRVIHVILEKKRFLGKNISLNDFLVYLIYFPSFTAGPIARMDQFLAELAASKDLLIQDDFLEGGRRICRGLFYKIILADYLAIISIGQHPVSDYHRHGWLWLLVVAYSARILLDFAGYTDIAIGISRLVGIRLPENFNQPYTAPNLAVFWNRWHITLTQWFRTYYFNPFVRFFRANPGKIPPVFVVFFTQITTMLLISLWHGITLNFVMWGLWHGVGLFLHNRWTEVIRPKLLKRTELKSGFLPNALSVFGTFTFVSLGWVWFAIPDFPDALAFFQKLFNLV